MNCLSGVFPSKFSLKATPAVLSARDLLQSRRVLSSGDGEGQEEGGGIGESCPEGRRWRFELQH